MLNIIKFNFRNLLNIKSIFLIIVINIIFISIKIQLELYSINNMISVFEGPIYSNIILNLTYMIYKLSCVYIISTFFYQQINLYMNNIIIRLTSIKQWILSILITAFFYTIIYHGITIIISYIYNINNNSIYIDVNLFILNIMSTYMYILMSLFFIIIFYERAYITSLYITFIYLFSTTLFLMNTKIGKIIPVNHSFMYFKESLYLSYIYLLISTMIMTFLTSKTIYSNYEKIMAIKGEV